MFLIKSLRYKVALGEGPKGWPSLPCEQSDERTGRARWEHHLSWQHTAPLRAGAGPAPELDGENIAFGEVLEGLDVLATIAAVPVIRANETLERYNAIAGFLGDDRAAKARAKWGKPLQAVVIVGAGVL